MKWALLAVIVGGLMMFQVPTHAEIYKWVDDQGTTHFTEDPSTIPDNYREKAKTRTTEEDLMPLEQRIKQKNREEAELRERIRKEKNESEIRKLEQRLKDVIDSTEKEKREAERIKTEASSAPSPGYIPFEKFKYIQKGMAEAEVLARLGPPTREERDEVKSSGTVSGGTVSGHVSPGGSLSGTVSGRTYAGETVVVKKYYYIGDRSKGEQTRVIIFEKGKVVDFQTTY